MVPLQGNTARVAYLGKDPGEGVASNHPSEDPYQLVLPFGGQVIIYATRIEVVDVTEELVRRLLRNYDEIYDLSPESFENLIQGRICAMGYEARRVGHIFSRDGGLDILFWPARPCPVPFLGAVQVKHHRARNRKTEARPSQGAGRDNEFAPATNRDGCNEHFVHC